MSITKGTQVVRQNPEEPLRDPTLALLVRFLEENPNLSVVPEFPGPFEMYKLVSKVQSVDRTRFSVLFGSEALAAYHWLKPGSGVSPAVGRLMLYFKLALQSRDPNDRAEVVDQWRSTVTEEAQARGVLDIFRTGA